MLYRWNDSTWPFDQWSQVLSSEIKSLLYWKTSRSVKCNYCWNQYFFRRWLALNEIAEEGQKPIITIYDLTTYKRRKILTVPFENSTAREFACVQFSYDSKYLVAVTGEPDWYLYYYNWDKGKVESHAKAQNPSGQGTVESVSIR